MKRIVAHCILDSDSAEVKPVLNDIAISDGIITGLADDATIESLRSKGIVIEELPDSKIEAAPLDRMILHGPRKAFSQDLFRNFGPGPTEVDLSVPRFYLIWLNGPLLESWRKQLANMGIELLEAYPGNAFRARMTFEYTTAVSKLSFVAGQRLFSGSETTADLTSILSGRLTWGMAPVGEAPMVTMDIVFESSEDRTAAQIWCEEKGTKIVGTGRRKVRILIAADDPLLAEIASLPGVLSVEEYIEPEPYNDRARELTHLPAVQNGVAGLTGAGVIIGIADTGIDDSHQDFGTRISHLIAKGRAGNTSDPHGHGTHVAGSVLGDGSASAGLYSGPAPAATLVFQSLLDSSGRLGGLPVDLNDLFDEAYNLGVRIHNNSWGSVTASRYTASASEVDEFVESHRDMLIVISAGNDGIEATRSYSASGFVDWLSIGSPATAKNGLTVGASRSDRLTGGISATTWALLKPRKYKNPPIAHETVSGDPESLAAFSSRGPCDNNSIKPDLVAPGTSIISTKSSHANPASFEGVVPLPQPPLTDTYAYLSGTSMAAPIVSGCAALIREFFVSRKQHAPSAALLKATLVNGTRMLRGSDATAPPGTTPNYHQGHGCVDMLWTLPSLANPGLVMNFIDNWQDPAQHLTGTGQYQRYGFTVGPASQLRLTLAYTDIPARSLQNDLNLFVVLPDNSRLYGNQGRNTTLPGPDHENNLEVISLVDPPPGPYVVVVLAYNILRAGQDFALVVVGENIGPLVRI